MKKPEGSRSERKDSALNGTLGKVSTPARLFLFLTVVLWSAGPRQAMGADSGSSEDRKKSRNSQEFMRELAEILEMTASLRWGRYPASTAESDVRTLLSGPGSGEYPPLRDDWGTPLRIEVTKDRQHLRLISAGADRRFETYPPLDAKVPTRKELDDPAGDIVFVDGEIVQGLKPLPPPEPRAAELKKQRLKKSRELAQVLGAKNTSCALVNEEAVLRLLPPGSDAVRTENSTSCSWTWWPPPDFPERTFNVWVLPGQGAKFHDDPPPQSMNVEGVGDEARWEATNGDLFVRRGPDLFWFRLWGVPGDKKREKFPLEIPLARAALRGPASPKPTSKAPPR